MALQQVRRQERKFLIGEEQRLSFYERFGQVLHEDPHNGTTGYKVRTLYFDTLYDKDYADKVDGVELRRKIRLRIYPPEYSFALLEIKQKQGANQLKRSIRISREHAEQVMRGNYNSLLEYDEPFAVECYGLMNMLVYRPKVVIEYTRKAYILPENNIRITFDSNIRATQSNMNILDDNLALTPVIDQTRTVLEVKYNNFLLSYVRDIINCFNNSEISVSKYVMARKNNTKINS